MLPGSESVNCKIIIDSGDCHLERKVTIKKKQISKILTKPEIGYVYLHKRTNTPNAYKLNDFLHIAIGG